MLGSKHEQQQPLGRPCLYALTVTLLSDSSATHPLVYVVGILKKA